MQKVLCYAVGQALHHALGKSVIVDLLFAGTLEEAFQ